MSINTHILNASGSLSQFRSVIQKTSAIAVKRVAKAIPVDNVDIVFYDNYQGTIEHLGFGGFTMTQNLVMIPINSSFPNLKNSLEENLPRTIAHELYHCLRNYAFNKKSTLLEALINEGLADHFDIEINGKEPEKWDTALTETQFKELYKRAKKEFDSFSYNHRAWFFGSEKDNLPRWTGYSIGFRIVGDYLKKHPDKKSSNLYRAEVKEFIY
jgi:uncharacterized protein YjaZ